MYNRYFARPYDTSKKGFSFTCFEEYKKNKEFSDIEEFELMYIAGDLNSLFDACDIDQTNIECWFNSVECLDSDNQAKLFLLMTQGEKLTYALGHIEDVMIQEGNLLEAATEFFDECYLAVVPTEIHSYIDYEAFARDLRLGGDMVEFEYKGKTYTCINSNTF